MSQNMNGFKTEMAQYTICLIWITDYMSYCNSLSFAKYITRLKSHKKVNHVG